MARRHNYKKTSNRSGNDKNPDFKSDSKYKDVESDSSNNTSSEGTNNVKNGNSRSKAPVPASNDPEWYGRDPQLLRDAATLPFATPLGDPLHLYGGANDDIIPTSITNKLKWSNVADLYDRSVSGICSLHLKPGYGVNQYKTDPLNVCANAFYTHVRYVNSGRKNYDPADLMLYALTMADIYSFTLWLQRLYSYAFMYSQRNKYIGKALLLSNGIDYDNIVSNLANFRYWLNAFINKVSSFAVPSDIYFFKRRAFLYANYYIENGLSNIKDQLYQFVPDAFMQYGLDTGQKGCLTLLERNVTNPWTLNDIVSYANTLMSNITGDEDFGLMSGDILKAYGANIISLAPVPEDAGLIPVFDPYVLSQMKNANVVPLDSTLTYTFDGNTWSNGSVMQTNDGLLVTKPFVHTKTLSTNNNVSETATRVIPLINDKIISVETPAPNEGDIVEATRLSLCWDGETIADDTGTGTDVFFNSGTEICVSVITSTFAHMGTSALTIISSKWDFSAISHISNTSGNYEMYMEQNSIVHVSGFKYHPIVYGIHILNTSGYYTVERVYIASNVDNYTKVGSHNLRKLHECALLSLFYVPGVAKMINNI